MALRLTLSGGALGRSTQTLAGGTLSIGRGERNDWQLPDPDRHLSKTHCVISDEAGRFVLTDLSTNGVYINGAQQPTTRDSRVVLTDGDTFRIGDYTISIEEVAAPSSPAPRPGIETTDPLGGDPLGSDPLDDLLGRPPDPSFRHPVQHVPPPRAVVDPFDRLEEERPSRAAPDDDLFAGTKPTEVWAGPAQADNVDAARQAMPPLRVVSAPAFSDDDLDALIGDLSAPQPLAPVPQPPQPPSMPPPSAPPPPPRLAEREERPPPAAAPAAPVAPPSDAMRAGLQAFLEGAGVPDARVGDDPEAVLRNVGEVFRALTEGVRDVLMSRAAIKGELRVEQTLLKSSDNNALKFSFNADEAVIALLSARRPGYKAPLAAAREAFDDIKTHELAVMAGVQTALMSLLQRFDPESLEARLAQGMIANLMPATRKARLWENFRDLYATIATEAEDDFQAVFGRAFAKAYKATARRE